MDHFILGEDFASSGSVFCVCDGNDTMGALSSMFDYRFARGPTPLTNDQCFKLKLPEQPPQTASSRNVGWCITSVESGSCNTLCSIKIVSSVSGSDDVDVICHGYTIYVPSLGEMQRGYEVIKACSIVAGVLSQIEDMSMNVSNVRRVVDAAALPSSLTMDGKVLLLLLLLFPFLMVLS
ncbi:hypothetical protein ERJ75_001808600 [Trypanosoma vivax]|nr:hypothetical protein ERJ75_001808600 [Trypanosoma vivax]